MVIFWYDCSLLQFVKTSCDLTSDLSRAELAFAPELLRPDFSVESG